VDEPCNNYQNQQKIEKNMRKRINKFWNKAVEFIDIYQKRQILKKKLRIESALVMEESMNVLHEFEDVEK